MWSGWHPKSALRFFIPDLSYLSIKLSLLGLCPFFLDPVFLPGQLSALRPTGNNEYVGINVLTSVLPGEMFAF